MESLYESWAKRNPSWERRYQSTVVDVFCDYGKGVSSFLEARGKIFGAGYEIFIIAFFIGLYHNRTKPLIEDRDKKKVFGQAIQYWEILRIVSAEPHMGIYVAIFLLH